MEEHSTATHEELFAEALEIIRSSNDEKSCHALQLALNAVLQLRKESK